MSKSISLIIIFLLQIQAFSQGIVNIGNTPSNSMVNTNNLSNKESNEYLIIFKRPCLIQQLSDNSQLKSATISQSIKNEHEQFVSDLWKIRKSNLKSASIPEIKQELFNTINAVIIESNDAEIEKIKTLGYIRNILKNERIQFKKESISNNIQKTRSIASEGVSNESGEGMKVGVIDTGIDYKNPALGGGFGPKYKVAGGYDFENKDNDPMDDDGHGTSVAGVIAANGQLTGIAPKATLYAFKTMNAWGWGWSNNIILALDRCVDPNVDYNISDHVNVVNMSIAVYFMLPEQKAELSSIFKYMEELKMIVCVAAGNEGPEYSWFNQYSIPSEVLSVGSCNSQNNISSFSSRNLGLNNNYEIKPDLVALGENVNVLGLFNTTAPNSGTSLSCPVVTGIAALLKQKHKDWTNKQIKSALINSADDLGFNVMEQGGGRVNQTKSLYQNTTVLPQTINWGTSTKNSDILNRTCKIQIYNHSASTQVYKFDFGQNLPEGITFRSKNSTVEIKSNDTVTVTLEMSVDQAKLKYPEKIPYNHFGIIKIQGTIDYLSVPWTILRGCAVNFNSDLVFANWDKPRLYILKDRKLVNLCSDFDTAQFQIVPPGKYDFLFRATEGEETYPFKDTLRSYFYVKENVTIDGGKIELNLTKKVIKNRILFQSVDESGKLLSIGKTLVNKARANYNIDYFEMIAIKDKSNLFEPVIQTGFMDEYYINDLPKSDKYQLYAGDYKADIGLEKKYTLLNYEVPDEIKNDLILKNSPQDLFPYHFMFNPTSHEKCFSGVSWGQTDLGYSPPDFHLFEPTFTTLWINKKNEGQLGLFPVPGIFISEKNENPSYFSSFDFSYPYGDSILFKSLRNTGRSEFQPVYKNDTIWVNNGPVYYSLNMDSRYNYRYFGCYSFLKGMYGERYEYGYNNSSIVIIDQNNDIVYQNKVSAYNTNPYTGTLEGATVEISTNDYFINQKRGKALLQYQLGSEVPEQFTSILSMQFLNNQNKLQSIFKVGSKGKLRLILDGTDHASSIKLNFKLNNESEWKNKTFTINKNQYNENVIETDISDLLADESDIAFKIVVEDDRNYTMSYTLEPAISVTEKKLYNNLSDQKITSHFLTYPNPTKNFITIKNVSGIKKTVVSDLNGKKLIEKTVAIDSENITLDISKLSSGVYILTTIGDNGVSSEKILKL
jgi:subtilisin family serine protease